MSNNPLTIVAFVLSDILVQAKVIIIKRTAVYKIGPYKAALK